MNSERIDRFVAERADKGSVVRTLLVPAIAFICLISLFFVVHLQVIQDESLENSSLSRLDFYKTEFHKSFNTQASELVSMLDLLANQAGVKPALIDQDRETLRSLLQPIFDRLQSGQGITHFYFHTPDLKNIIRFHEYERFGDQIERRTSLDAAQKQIITYGFEVGVLGTYTIRAVSPVFAGDRLIGFIELGKEIEDIARDVSSSYDINWSVFVDKALLNEDDWTRGMQLLDRPSDWSQYESVVLVSTSDDQILSQLTPERVQQITQARDELITVDEAHRIGVIDLYDVENLHVGWMGIHIDQSEQVIANNRRDQIASMLFVPVLLLVSGMIWWIMRRADLRVAAQQKKLQYQVYHDALTNLPNRKLFYDRLHHAIDIAERRSQKLAVVFIDLDNFKDINDSLGHAVGDEVLTNVARSVSQIIRKEDTLARISGDEFVILMEQIENINDSSVVAEKISNLFAEELGMRDLNARLTASIGIAVYPTDAKDPDELVINADRAMYQAKSEGKNRYRFFNEQLALEGLRRITIEQKLRDALMHERFYLLYQPQIDVRSSEVSGVEALIRWEDAELGFISPAEFIPIAESSGLINQLGRWVLRTACAQAADWHERGMNFGRLAVNISPKQLTNPDFQSDVLSILESYDLPPTKLELEVTEGVFLSTMTATTAMLHSLKDQGVTIAVDDFGTGYSSLSKIRSLPISTLKIDKSFIDSVPADESDTTITLTILALAQNLGLQTIAEGVENVEQLEFLRKHRCDHVQGYHFSRPINAEEFEDRFSVAVIEFD